MTKNVIVTVGCLLIAVAHLPATAQEPDGRDAQASQAMGLLTRLIGGTWVFEGTREGGERVRSEIRYSKGPSSLSVFLDIRISVDGALMEKMRGTFAYHPGIGRVVFHTVNSQDSYQYGEEIESTDSSVVFSGAAYHARGEIDQWVWRVRSTDRDQYLDDIQIFTNGAWQERSASMFRRVR